MRKLVPFVVVVVVLTTALLLSQRGEGPLLVSGFIESDEIRVGSRVGGRVAKVHVEEGESVRAGQVLVELEPFDLLERRAQATADVAARRADHERLTAGFRDEDIAQAEARRDQLDANLRRMVKGPRDQEIEVGRARVRLAEAEVELAEVENERMTSLEAGVVSESVRDAAARQLKVAQSRLDSAQQELALLEEGTRAEDVDRARAELAEAEQAWTLAKNGFRVEEVAMAEAALESAQAALEVIQREIAELEIRAPVDAVVESLLLRPGDLVAKDAPVLSLHDPARLWVRAYVPENRLVMKLEDRVPVRVDSFPNERFTARVGFIARRAEFTPRNVQTPEERSKQVFRIKVYLEEGLDRLRPGMGADVWLEGEE